MADRLAGGNQVGDFIAAQQVPEAVAEHAAPHAVQHFFRCLAKCFDRVNAGCMQAGLGAASDAGEVTELQFVEHLWQVLALDEEKSVGLAHL